MLVLGMNLFSELGFQYGEKDSNPMSQNLKGNGHS